MGEDYLQKSNESEPITDNEKYMICGYDMRSDHSFEETIEIARKINAAPNIPPKYHIKELKFTPKSGWQPAKRSII